MEAWMWMTIAAFFAGLVYTLVSVFNATGKSDNKADMSSAIMTVTALNAVLVLILAGAAYFYTEQYPTTREPYIMGILHLNLLLSIISVSVASLFSVSN